MTDNLVLENRRTINAISKITKNIFVEFRRKANTAAIFFDIKKGYNKINRNKTFEQLKNLLSSEN